MKFEVEGIIYNYELEIIKEDSYQGIKFESLRQFKDGEFIDICKRDTLELHYNDQKISNLNRNKSFIYLFKEDNIINKIFNALKYFLKRNFGELNIKETDGLSIISDGIIKNTKSKEEIFFGDYTLSAKLYLLKKKFNDDFKSIIKYFKNSFKSIETVDFDKIDSFSGFLPLLNFKEKDIEKWFPINELSTGMYKVLLIITDLILLPDDSIYIIDEYENSLGLNAIKFLPDLIWELDTRFQLVLTSHHPYLINNIPIKDWIVLSRNKSHVSIKQGEKLIDEYGKSKHDHFSLLINDKFYLGQ